MENQRLGKYELLELLGSGATSDVYYARDTELGREVALKMLKPALIVDASALQRFIHEARSAAGLFHSHIATVLDFGQENGRFYLVLRYIPGQSLNLLLKEGPLPWPEAQRMVQQIGAALDYAHQRGFIHRDVKPSNIIRTPEGDFVLTDFGLVRAMMSTGVTTHSGAILGTPAYIAPEIWLNLPAVPATDQYSLACVLYEVLTGQQLFLGDTPPAVMARHLLTGPQLPDSWPAGTPAELSAVLSRALSRQPEDRYPSLAALAEALSMPASDATSSLPSQEVQAAVLAPASSSAGGSESGSTRSGFVSPNRLRLLGLGCGAVILVLILIYPLLAGWIAGQRTAQLQQTLEALLTIAAVDQPAQLPSVTSKAVASPMSPSLTFSVTHTPLPTLTLPASPSPTLTATPTSTLTPTFTPSPTSTRTPKPEKPEPPTKRYPTSPPPPPLNLSR